MNQSVEQDIPIWAFIAGFVVLMVVSTVLRKRLRQKSLVSQGQVETEGGRVPMVEERLAGNPVWASGEIRSKGRKFIVALWVAALFWNLLFGIGLIKAMSNPVVKTAPLVVLGVFVALGLAFVVFTVRATLRYVHFGESRCRISGKAGVLGTKMSGIIRTRNEIQISGDYTIELQCLDTYTTGSGDKRRTEVSARWQDKQRVAQAGSSSTSGIPFSFDIPDYPPETGDQLARGTVSWQLKIHAPVKGVDYAASFTVPVFKMDYSK